MAPSFYAEYLPNIKSVTITLSNVEPGSSYGLTSPGTDLRIVSPKGEAATIPLPATCNASRSAGMRVSQDPTRAEQTVVRVSAEPFSTSFTRQTGADEEPLVPWSASQLHARIEVSCKACSAVAVKQGKITTWKDLPSEGWAEMMDLWHCHKPDEHDHGGGVDAKGYAAGSKLVARRGVGLVDALGFLIKAEDCVNLEVEPSIPPETTTKDNDKSQQKVSCKTCSATLGFADEQTEGLKLLKPFLTLSHPSPSAAASSSAAPSVVPLRTQIPTKEQISRDTFTTGKWLAAYLLTLIESTGVRKFLVKGGSSSGSAADFEIWVFSTSLAYTSSTNSASSSIPISSPSALELTAADSHLPDVISQTKPTEAMKVLFKRGTPARHEESAQGRTRKDGESLSKANLMVEELRLPLGLETQLWRCLEDSREMLPRGARKFLDWDVGLLTKFKGGDEVVWGS